jgi:hypothetical protein
MLAGSGDKNSVMSIRNKKLWFETNRFQASGVALGFFIETLQRKAYCRRQ